MTLWQNLSIVPSVKPAPRIAVYTFTAHREQAKPPQSSVKSTDKMQPLTLAAARVALQPSAEPDALPCRESEHDTVAEFIDRAIRQTGAEDRCLYIYGTPGTGKTATVRSVLSEVQADVKARSCPKFDLVWLNALRLAQPSAAYTEICESLLGDKLGSSRARDKLEQRFVKSKTNRPVLMVIDEIDALSTGKQSVLYMILEWASRPKSCLCLIAIANMLALSTVLLPRLASRAGLRNLQFDTYNTQQLETIVATRLNSTGVFVEDAIRLAAMRIAKVTGDARRALFAARRATEVAEAAGAQKVTLMHMQQALQDLDRNPSSRLVKSCSLHELVFLCALAAATGADAQHTATAAAVMERHRGACLATTVTAPTYAELSSVMARLAGMAMLQMDSAVDGPHAQLHNVCELHDLRLAAAENRTATFALGTLTTA
eukprot:TRINITY_DN5375_c0_g1_i1.p1 TRINITY_DN5375_c0_g1~~TRINITY_DN5375_c0_g1_i1.p1  ORF type:complete len:431 (-),score=76.69 TRINITY_DN5375_c0_g1_i1:1292-2584(-)